MTEVFRVGCAPSPPLLEALEEIEASCFSLPLSREQILSLLRNELTVWLAYGGQAAALGSLWFQRVLDEGYIGNVAVLPAFRRRGIADALLDAAEALAREMGLRFLTLEVRAGNAPAVALYEKHGYRRVGTRPGYYVSPKEDALLMTRFFRAEAEESN